MIEVSSLAMLIVAEVIVGLLVLSGFLLLSTLLRKGRIRKAAVHLAERVQSDKAKREQRLKGLLQERYRLTGTDLDQTLHNIMRTEMLLYQNVINGFLKDDQVHLQQLDVDVENLVIGYQGLPLPESAIKTNQASAEDEEEITRLRVENERLSEELRVTMDTMGRMLNEYSTMFSGGAVVGKSATTKTAEAAEEDQRSGEDMEEDGAEADDRESTQQQTVAGGLEFDTEIPEISAEELQQASHLTQDDDFDTEDSDSQQQETAANASLDDDDADTDEDVSEIIDEVMEIADEMLEEPEIPTQTQSEPLTETEVKSGESMVDDLENIDIEIPADSGSLEEGDEFEAGSLEEEWAKLLEEDAANSKKQEQDP